MKVARQPDDGLSMWPVDGLPEQRLVLIDMAKVGADFARAWILEAARQIGPEECLRRLREVAEPDQAERG